MTLLQTASPAERATHASFATRVSSMQDCRTLHAMREAGQGRSGFLEFSVIYCGVVLNLLELYVPTHHRQGLMQ